MEDRARRAKALQLHLAGHPYRSIQDRCGYSSLSSAYRAVQAAMDDLGAMVAPEEVRSEATKAELARLQVMRAGLWPKARKGDTFAIDRVLKIDAREAQILMMETAAVAAEKEQTEQEGAVVSDFQRRLEERRARSANS